MSTVYQYKKHIHWGQYVIPVFFSILFILYVFMVVTLCVDCLPLLGRVYSPSKFMFLFVVLFLIICGGVIIVVESFLLWYFYYRLAGVRITIENDGIIYQYRKGEKRIDFDKITKIKLPSIRYVGGWITIIAGKEKIRLTVVVNEIGDFVRTLKASLDSNGLSYRYDESKLFRFLKTAVYSDQSWSRGYFLLWKMILATFGLTLLGVGIALASDNVGFFWTLFSFVFPMLLYLFTEIIFGVRIAKKSVRESFFVPPKDTAYENRVYKVVFMAGIIIYLTLALALVL